MVMTVNQQAVEMHYGKPLKQVITELYVEHRDTEVVASKLGVTRGALALWRKQIGLSMLDLRLAVLAHDHPNPTVDSLGNENG